MGRKIGFKRAMAIAGLIGLCSAGFSAAGKIKEEWILQNLREEMLAELERIDGKYNADVVVLNDTTINEAEEIAECLNASLRITKQGDYAALYLPENLTIEDVYQSEAYEQYLEEMSPDYYASLAAVDANDNPLYTKKPAYTANDLDYDVQEYLNYLDMRDTWNLTRGSGVSVAVIDTGIDTDHEEFKGKISEQSYNASEDKMVKDYGVKVVEDTDGHGTAVAGVLAANMDNQAGIVGIAPDIELVVIKCKTDESGEFVSTSDLVFGLAYAIECDVDVINMSFGTVASVNDYARYTKLAVDSDIICVAGAGNGSTGVMTYPAADENVIGVGAMDLKRWSLASYSNFGDNSDLVAPGTVYTTQLGGGYGFSEGTSMATPIVSGAVALYLASNPYTEYSDICDLLQASSVDIGTLGEDWYHGYGALDVHAFLYEEKGTITYEMMTDEINNQSQIFVKGHTIQYMPEPERENEVFDGWYYDMECTDEVEYYTERFTSDVTLYASWINEDEGTAYLYSILKDGTVEIQSYTGKRRYLTVPKEIEGRKVTRIGESAFADNDRLRTVTLPEGIVAIGDRAFVNCTGLRGIEIPEKVVSIGNFAFNGCTRLSTVTMAPRGELVSIGSEAFGMSGIESISIPANVNSLGERLFYGSTALASVSVAEGNTVFMTKNAALYNAGGDTLIYYPAGKIGNYEVAEGTKAIADYAFSGARIKQVSLPEGLEDIGQACFENSYIYSVDLPDSLQNLCAGSFKFCQNLSKVDLGTGGYVEVQQETFSGCSRLGEITIPAQIVSLGQGAFGGSGLTNVEFEKDSKIRSIGEETFAFSPLEEIYIPAGVTVIDDKAFANCTSLKEVVFAENSQCSKIGDQAFMNSQSLKRIEFPDAVTEVGEQAFYDSALEELVIGAGLQKIDVGSFSACQFISSIEVVKENPVYESYEGVLYNEGKTSLLIYPSAKNGRYVLPDSVKEICAYAFAEADKLSEVVLNNGLTVIDKFAFTGCDSLQTPILPATLITIGENSFEYCKTMSGKIIIPKNVKSIGRYAFYEDYDLTQIEIESESVLSRIGYGALGYCGITNFTVPCSVSSMAQEVFIGCKNLVTVTFEADSQLNALATWTFAGADSLRRVTFEEGSRLQIIEARAFEGLEKLDKMDLTNCTMLRKIGNYAFVNCSGLETILLPENLVEIGRYAFNNCSKLADILLPSSIDFIGRYAFKGTAEVKVYFKASALPVNLEENWDYGIGEYYLGTASKHTSGDWSYILTDNQKVSVVGYTGSDTALILDKLDGYEVVSIGAGVFKNNTTLQSIVLPGTLTGIYQGAFAGTTALKEIQIPTAVTIIDSEAFRGSALQSVTFDKGSALKVLGQYAFAETSNLAEIALPNGVEKIRDYTFYRSNIKELLFNEGTALTEIGKYAFAKSGLQEICLPDKLQKIDQGAFRENDNLKRITFGTEAELQFMNEAFYDTGLTAVEIPENVKYIGELCFADCDSLTDIHVAAENVNYTSVDGILFDKAAKKLITCPAGKTGSYDVPATVTTFAFAAFEGCKLSEINMPEDGHLLTIGYRTFYRCSNLTSISIPNSVQSIENYAFAYCENLENVTIHAECQMGGIYAGAFYGCKKLSSILIPNGVQEIGDYAFYGCESLKEVPISENSQLKVVNAHAFEYSGITSFQMPDKMLEVGDYAFHGTSLKTFKLNEAVTDLGAYALADTGLTAMTELRIPDSVEYIGFGLLRGVNSIQNISIPFIGAYLDDEVNTSFKYLYGGNDVNIHRIELRGGTFVGAGAFGNYGNTFTVEEIQLPDSLVEIGESSFSYCTAKEIVIPDNVTRIKKDAFSYALAEKVVLPKKLKEIGEWAFWTCENLVEIDIPEQVNSIGEMAFCNCRSLKRVTIPASTKMIGNAAFSGCSNLEEIVVDEENKDFCSVDGILYNYSRTEMVCVPGKISGEVTIPEGIVELGERLFANCENITAIKFPSSLRKIDTLAFTECHGLTEVEIPENVQEVGVQVFSGCKGLKSLVIKAKIKDLKSMVTYCTALESIEFPEGLEHTGAFWECGFKTLILPDSVKTVDSFNDCKNLQYLQLGDSVEIADGFYGCSSLEYLSLGKSVKQIGRFDQCQNLSYINVSEQNTSFMSKDGILYSSDGKNVIVVPKKISGKIELPEGIETIVFGAFGYCDLLEEIVLPESVKKIEDGAFEYCTNLKKISFGRNIESIGAYILEGSAYSHVAENSYDGVLYVNNYAVGLLDAYQKDYHIKEGTKLLSDKLFYMNDRIESIYLPSSVEGIGRFTFCSCANLKEVRRGDGIRRIGVMGFAGCASLKSIYLPLLERMDNNAFYECENLKQIYIGNNTIFHEQEPLWTKGEIEVLKINLNGADYKYISNNTSCSKFILEKTDGITAHTFEGISGCTFFIKEDKKINDLPAGWNNGNRVYYKNEWNLASFFVNGVLLQMNPVISTAVVQTPAEAAVLSYFPAGSTFSGWDTTGDGIPDKIPATLIEDLHAEAVINIPLISMEIIESNSPIILETGEKKSLTVNCNPKFYNETAEFIWSSSDEAVVSVDETGTVLAVSEGTAVLTVTAKDDPKVTASCMITVFPVQYGIKLDRYNGEMKAGEMAPLNPRFVLPEGYTAETEWSSSDESIAVVEDGVIFALAPGDVRISIVHGEYQTEYVLSVKLPLENVSLETEVVTMNVDETFQMTVNFEPANTTDSKEVVWSTLHPSIVSVDYDGVITAKKPGTATIIAIVGRHKLSCEVTVLAPLKWIKLNTNTGTMRLDRTKQMEVILEPSNTTDDTTVTWMSDDSEIASVDENGLVTARKSGKTVITGAVGELSDTYSVTVVGIRDSETGIIVVNADDTPMPDSIALEVNEYGTEEAEEEYQEVLESINEENQDEIGKTRDWTVYDIYLHEDGTAVQPEQEVDVEFPTNDQTADGAVVYYLGEDGTYTNMNATYEDDKLTFATDHFSTYAVGALIDCSHNDESKWEVRSMREATCEETGYTGDTYCKDCGKQFLTGSEIAALGHGWNTGEVTKEAGCVEAGIKRYTCEICGNTYTEEIAANNHSFQDYVSDNNATCETDGTKTAKCENCDASDTVPETGSAKKHSGEKEIRNVKEATYEESGYTGDTYCRDCGKLIQEGEIIPQLGKKAFIITYQLNGGKNHHNNPVEYTEDTETIILQNPSKTGYIFQGWYRDSNYKTKVTEIAKGTGKNITLYAKWSAISYKIAYHANGGTGSMKKISTFYDKQVNLTAKTFKRSGYVFAGWNTKSNGSGKTYADKAVVKNLTTKSGATVTLYAQWKEKTYSITYKLNGGVNHKKNPVSYTGKKEIKLQNPTRAGYKFQGWYQTKKYKKKLTKINKGSKKNITLYAKWTANKYKITYDKNGGKGKLAATNAVYGKNVKLRKNTFKRKGYTFAGWNTKKNGSGSSYTNKQSVKNLTAKSGGTVVLYAQWKSSSAKQKKQVSTVQNNSGIKETSTVKIPETEAVTVQETVTVRETVEEMELNSDLVLSIEIVDETAAETEQKPQTFAVVMLANEEDQLNVRSEMDLEAEILLVLNHGDRVEVLDVQKEWAEICIEESFRGYVKTEYLFIFDDSSEEAMKEVMGIEGIETPVEEILVESSLEIIGNENISEYEIMEYSDAREVSEEE